MGCDMNFKDYVRSRRLELGLTLREFCRQINEDPSNWSKVERGVIGPPEHLDKLHRISKVLGFAENSKETKDLFNMADIDRGRIPRSIMHDEALIAHLPVLFRSIDSSPPNTEELLSLADLIRKAHEA